MEWKEIPSPRKLDDSYESPNGQKHVYMLMRIFLMMKQLISLSPSLLNLDVVQWDLPKRKLNVRQM